MMTASRRAKATIAFFIPRRLAICRAQALSQDHFFECNNALRCFVEHHPHHLIPAARYPAAPVDFA
jgi:hypothetical protein